MKSNLFKLSARPIKIREQKNVQLTQIYTNRAKVQSGLLKNIFFCCLKKNDVKNYNPFKSKL